MILLILHSNQKYNRQLTRHVNVGIYLLFYTQDICVKNKIKILRYFLIIIIFGCLRSESKEFCSKN